MPAQLTHWLAGKQAAAAAGWEFSPTETVWFNLGCQGPDVFAHNRRTRPLGIAFARLVHHWGYGLLVRMLAEHLGSSVHCHNPSSFELRAWLLGFMTHAAVDRALHPYIVSRIPAHSSAARPASMHAFFERITDVLMLRELESLRITDINTRNLFVPETAPVPPLVQAFTAALVKAYPRATDGDPAVPERINNAFTDSFRFYTLTSPHTTAFSASPQSLSHFIRLEADGVALLYPDEPDPSVDWLNLSRDTWLDPVNGTARTESLVDLFSACIPGITAILKLALRVCSGEESPAALETAIGNGSLSIAAEDGSPVAPAWWSPLPLDAELLRQTRLREQWMSTAVIDQKSVSG